MVAPMMILTHWSANTCPRKPTWAHTPR